MGNPWVVVCTRHLHRNVICSAPPKRSASFDEPPVPKQNVRWYPNAWLNVPCLHCPARAKTSDAQADIAAYLAPFARDCPPHIVSPSMQTIVRAMGIVTRWRATLKRFVCLRRPPRQTNPHQSSVMGFVWETRHSVKVQRIAVPTWPATYRRAFPRRVTAMFVHRIVERFACRKTKSIANRRASTAFHCRPNEVRMQADSRRCRGANAACALASRLNRTRFCLWSALVGCETVSRWLARVDDWSRIWTTPTLCPLPADSSL